MRGALTVGLFGKKNSKKNAVAPAAVTIKAAPTDEKTAPAVAMGSDDFFKSEESKSVKGHKSIKQSTVDEKIAIMERELADRPEPLDYKSYDKNPVREKELDKANEDFAEICAQVSEKESMTRYNIIRSALQDDMDKKVEELANIYDYLSDENYDRNTAEFNEVYDDEKFRRTMEIDMQFAEKREKAKSNMPSLTDEQLEAIRKFEESDIKAKPIEKQGEIPALSAKVVDELTAKFEEKYNRIAKEKVEQDRNASDTAKSEEDAELARLRAMFG